MESTKGKVCPEFCLIEAIGKNQGVYSVYCDEECAKYSAAYGTCIDFVEKATNIQKALAKYK